MSIPKLHEIKTGFKFIGFDDKVFEWTCMHFEMVGRTKPEGVDIDEVIKSGIPITKENLPELGFRELKGASGGDMFRETFAQIDVAFRKGSIMVKSNYQGYTYYMPTGIECYHEVQDLISVLDRKPF